jgi:PAS domain S-box-containing protein
MGPDVPPVRDALAAAVEYVQNVILLADDEQRYVYANAAASQILGYTNEEFLHMTLWDLTPVPDQETARRLWAAFIDDGRQSGEFRIACKDGEVRVFQYNAVANVVPGIHMSDLHDITNLVFAEQVQRERVEEKKLLIEEMHHRVRNNLAAVLGVLRMQAGGDNEPSVREFVSHVATRIDAMFEANRLLRDVGTKTRTTSLRTLLTEITRTTVAAMALQPDHVKWSVESSEYEIAWEDGSLVALILNEVLTNFLKHSLATGEKLEMNVSANGDDLPHTTVRVEFSRPFATPPETWSRGFGMRLLDTLAHQLGAEIEWEPGTEAAAFVLRAGDGG